MHRRISSPIAGILTLPLSRKRHRSQCKFRVLMAHENSHSNCQRMHANFRLCNVSGYTTELLEIRAQDPSLNVLFIPGNPAIGHISHAKKDWEHGSLFSLQEQIDHKVGLIKNELQNIEVPIILVGHSIGSYIAIELFKYFEQVRYCIGLYPFLAVNPASSNQSTIRKIAASPVLCAILSSIVALLGLLPSCTSRFIVKKSMGKSWSRTAIEAACSHLLQYHMMRNVLYMAMTEFEMLSETPDWEFMRGKVSRIAFLFGIDDHWGPLTMFEEISKQVPDIALSIEREGHTHSFCCTEAGSFWVAQHVASLIKSQISGSSQ